MSTPTSHPRINIYLDDTGLLAHIKIAAARHGVTISAYCVDAIRQRLIDEGLLSASETGEPERSVSPKVAAQTLDRLRQRLGTIGVPVGDLIADGRWR